MKRGIWLFGGVPCEECGLPIPESKKESVCFKCKGWKFYRQEVRQGRQRHVMTEDYAQFVMIDLLFDYDEMGTRYSITLPDGKKIPRVKMEYKGILPECFRESWPLKDFIKVNHITSMSTV